MNVLIVDDDVSMVRRLRERIDWRRYGIATVLSAYCVRSAQEIMEEFPVDILFCDIEMPQGSGLELVAWARERGYPVEVIFLTCHSEFDYARQAIAVDSFEYLLKPCSEEKLQEAIERVAERVRTVREKARYVRYGKIWEENRPVLKEAFWRDILSDSRGASSPRIRNLAESLGVAIDPQKAVWLVLLRARSYTQDLPAQKPDGLDEIVQGLAAQCLPMDCPSSCTFTLESKNIRCCAAVISGAPELPAAKEMEQRCLQLIDRCSKATGCFLSCYLARCLPGELSAACARLEAMDAASSRSSGVFFLKQRSGAQAGYQRALPDMRLMGRYFQQPNGLEQIVGLTADWLEARDTSDRLLMCTFREAFCRVRDEALRRYGMNPQEMDAFHMAYRLEAASLESAEGMLAYVRHMAGRYFDLIARKPVPDTAAVAMAKAFIREHYGEDLTLEDIASHVYLSADYLAKLFRRDTGASVMDFLIDCRISHAATLLAQTDDRIGDIAVQVGYDNFPYFSRLFRQKTGMSPREYRRLHGR